MNKSRQFQFGALLWATVCTLQLSAFGQGALTPPGAPGPLFKSLSQIEPRTPVAGGGAASISQPGSYYLTGNIAVSSGNGISISANNVKLDLNGFTVSSTANPASGNGVSLASALTNVCICNGFIFGLVTNNGAASYGGSGFANGISYTGNQPVNTVVTDVAVSGCLTYGINLNGNVGFNTGNTVDSCMVNDCGSFGILAELVTECSVKVGTGSGIFSATAARTRAVSYSGEGLHAAINAEACSGQSTSFYGINGGNLSINCYGSSTSHEGLTCSGATQTCYGQTTSGAYALSAGSFANNCMGYHSGPGGIGLFTAQLAIGSVGVTSGASGYGIYSGGILNGCIGTGATNVFFSFKYNMP